jgi:hypothetical protein
VMSGSLAAMMSGFLNLLLRGKPVMWEKQTRCCKRILWSSQKKTSGLVGCCLLQALLYLLLLLLPARVCVFFNVPLHGLQIISCC